MPHEPRDDKKKPEETRMTLRTSLLPMVILPKTKVPPKSDTSPQPPRQGKARRPRRHVGRILALIAATLVLVGGMAVWKIFDMGNWEKLDPDKLLNLQQTSLLYDRAGTLVTSLQGKENRTVVPLSQIPVHVQNAFIAAEDLRFYQHHGFDVIRMFGALLSNLKSKSYAQGASTITQQLVKLSHLTAEKTLARKVQEIYLAWQLEQDFGKDDILAMYLNLVYFGNGAYGIQAAAQAYFGKDVDALTLSEGATLAAAIKAPSAYAPHIKPDANRNRRLYVLDVMAENQMIPQKAADTAKEEVITVITQQAQALPYGWYVDAALAEAEERLGVSSEELLSGGYRIYTALDPILQDIADGLYANAKNFPDNAKDGKPVQSAMAVVDAATGELRALVGGRAYEVRRGLNRATQMRRQPGSVLKPLAVYAPAIQLGYTTASVLLDEPGDFNGYTPRNAGNRYYGPVTLRTAVAHSLNVSTVRLLREIGMPASRSFLQSAGIPLDPDDRNLSLALGSMRVGITPAELAASYALFANGGVYHAPHIITRIIGPDGTSCYTPQTQAQHALSTQNAYLMTSLLQSVTSWGTGSKLRNAGVPVAGKTGTVSLNDNTGNRDVWMAAFNPALSVSIWMGFDVTDSSHKLAGWQSGGDAPASLAAAFFKKAYVRGGAPSFVPPEGIISLSLDEQSVKVRGEPMLSSAFTPEKYRYDEVFLTSNRPTRVSDVWQPPRAPSLFYIEPGESGMPRLVFQCVDRATCRIERTDVAGGTVILHEMVCEPGVLQTYTDVSAQRGLRYTYRIIPLHTDLLAEGMALEGPSVSQVGQAASQAENFWNDLADFFAPNRNTPAPTAAPTLEPTASQSLTSLFW